MRGFCLGLSLSIIAVAIPDAVSAATRVRLVHPERQKMAPADRHDVVLADLNSILTGPASPTSIATAPYLSSTNGLCRRDVIDLVYAPRKEGDHDGPLRPAGVRVFAEYHYLGGEDTGSRDSWQRACERLAATKIYWARSEDDTAADALATLEQVVADVRKNIRFTIDCTALGDAAVKAGCTSEFLAAAPEISSAYRCPDQAGDCFRFGMGDYEVTMVRTPLKDASGGYSTAIIMDYPPILVT